MEQRLHVRVLQLENGEGDRAHTCPYQALFWVVQGEGRLEERECLQTIVEEKVNGLIVEAEDESFEEVDKVVGQFVILAKLELEWDQHHHERVPQ